MRKTKTFSYDSKDDQWFRRSSREAKRNGRTGSQQLIFVLRDYFERQAMLEEINRPKEAING